MRIIILTRCVVWRHVLLLGDDNDALGARDGDDGIEGAPCQNLATKQVHRVGTVHTQGDKGNDRCCENGSWCYCIGV